MIRQYGPAVILASALVAAVAIAVSASDSPSMFAAGALLFALGLEGADAWVSRLRGESSRPSLKGLASALAFLAACGISAVGDPQFRAEYMLILAGGAAAPVPLRRGCRREVR